MNGVRDVVVLLPGTTGSDDYHDNDYLMTPLFGIAHPTLQPLYCAGGKLKLQQSRDEIDQGGADPVIDIAIIGAADD